MILQCQTIQKTFVADAVLKDVTFILNEGDKASIVGINGAGKTTLFRIITGEMSADAGQILLPKDTTLGYLKQNALTESHRRLIEEVEQADPLILSLQRQLTEMENRIHDHEGSAEDLAKLNRDYDLLRHRFEQKNGYQYESLVRGVLKGLGFTDADHEKTVATLSGGQKTRVALAMELIRRPDILMLDEPTNHLDIDAIAWLESYLKGYPGTLLIISHDRYFLDQVTTKTIELERGFATVYPCPYGDYTQRKAKDQAIKLHHYENQQRDIKKQEAVIDKLKSFNREKSIKRAESREKQLAKIDRIEKPLELDSDMHLHLKPRSESGNDVLTTEGLAKSFGPLHLFDHLSFQIKKGEKVALIGDNGTGKSTLFKIINGVLPADGGTYKIGARVHVGYYDQEHQLLNADNRLIDEISDAYPAMSGTDIRNVLASYLFKGDDVFKQVSTLSGGEKGRLTLVKLMLSEANFLILDEPTNHLDMASKDILEKALKGYQGTLLFISHDRYFVNQVADKILHLNEGVVDTYLGNYDDFQSQRAKRRDLTTAQVTQPQATATKLSWQEEKARKAEKRKLENQFQETEENIHALEAAIEAFDAQLAQEAVYTDHVKAADITAKKEAAESQLEGLYETWETLHEALEAF